PEMVEEAELPEIVHEKPAEETPKKKPVFKAEPITPDVKETPKVETKPIVKEEVKTDTKAEPKLEKPAEEPKPVKKVDFEITNPDDIKIDDKGQLGFF
ncbi:MAG: hypothetical protein EOO91_19910, partial [Pedobacter sp.]